MSELYTTSAYADELEPFLRSYREDKEFKYMERINMMMPLGSTYIDIDYQDLNQSNMDLAIQLSEKPDDLLQALNESVYKVLKSIHPEYAEEIREKIKVRIANYQIHKTLREVDAEVINKLITVPAMIVRSSEVRPLAKRLVYQCTNCDIQTEANIKGSVVLTPSKCPECGDKNLRIIDEECQWTNFQNIRLQELPEELPAGQLPHYVEVTLLEDLIDSCRPGDRVLLTGIVRIESEKYGQKTVFKLHMEGNNVEHLAGLDGQSDSSDISDQDKLKIEQIASSQDAIEKLVASFAPHIYGHSIIKESIMLLVVGAVSKKLEDGTKLRGDINMFLVGDPGIAKSEMLKFAAKIVPRGLYTTGKGSSAAGLTAAVIHDKSGILNLETGAVVLGDQGTVCIDEFDKMTEADRGALHECMEQQTCSVAKGGIVATLNARTSILAAANPNGGRYDFAKNLVENVQPIPVPLLTRFDIIHVMEDKKDVENDTKIAEHILNVHNQSNKVKAPINIDLLRKYIVYSKKIEPELSKEASDLFKSYYIKMRGINTDAIDVTPRQLGGLIRLSTARARLLLKKQVDKEDAQRAIELYSATLDTLGIDIETGKSVEVSKPKTRIEVFKALLDKLVDVNDNRVSESNIIANLVGGEGWTEDEVRNMIKKFDTEGKIYEIEPNYWSKI